MARDSCPSTRWKPTAEVPQSTYPKGTGKDLGARGPRHEQQTPKAVRTTLNGDRQHRWLRGQGRPEPALGSSGTPSGYEAAKSRFPRMAQAMTGGTRHAVRIHSPDHSDNSHRGSGRRVYATARTLGITAYGSWGIPCDSYLYNAINTDYLRDRTAAQMAIQKIQQTKVAGCSPDQWAPQIAEYQSCRLVTTNPEEPLCLHHYDVPQSLTRAIIANSEDGLTRDEHGNIMVAFTDEGRPIDTARC